MDGWDRILERQARQLRTLGIALVCFAAFSAAAAIYLISTGDDFVYRFYGVSGGIVFGGSGIEAIRRSRRIERELAEKRRAQELPVAIARERHRGD